MTPNKERGEVLVKLRDFEVVMRPTFKAACQIEAETGYSITQLAQRMATSEAIGVGVVTAIIFHGSQAAGETRKRDQIGEAVVRTGLGNVTAPVVNFIANYIIGDEVEGAASGEEDAPAGDR